MKTYHTHPPSMCKRAVIDTFIDGLFEIGLQCTPYLIFQVLMEQNLTFVAYGTYKPLRAGIEQCTLYPTTSSEELGRCLLL